MLVVGCGSIGLRHLRLLCGRPDVEAAAMDVSPAAREAVAALGSGIRFFGDLDAAAAWKPDAAVVATPNGLHRDGCLWAFSAGAHVLCEKPLAGTMTAGRRIVEAAKASGKVLAVGYTERFRAALQYLWNECAAGNLGTLVGGRAMVGTYNTLLCAKDPRARAEAFGTLILDYVHELDILAGIFGDVKRLECFANRLGDRERKANPMLSAILLEYRSGAVVSLHMDYIQHPQRRLLEIYGDRRSMVYDWQADRMEIQ